MTSIADQDTVEMGGRTSVLTLQKRDHVELDRLLGELAGRRGAARGPTLLAIHRLVFPHAFAEESVLWPVIRRKVPNGEALTLENEKEHQAINELFTRMEAFEAGTPEHDALLDEVLPLLRADVRDEEDALLPGLQANVSPAQLRLLGIAWESVRRIAPTRPHPIVARRPPGNALSALPLTLVDRTRDTVDRLRFRAPEAAVPALRAVGLALTRASHAVERLPGLRSGENPATRVPAGRVGALPVLGATVALATSALLVRRMRTARHVPDGPHPTGA